MSMTKLIGAINENSITLEDNKTKIKDNLRDLRDKTIEVENEVLSALQKRVSTRN